MSSTTTCGEQLGDLAARFQNREQRHLPQRDRGCGSNNNRAVDRLDLGLGSLAVDPDLPVASDDPDVWPPPTPDPSRGAAAAQQGDSLGVSSALDSLVVPL